MIGPPGARRSWTPDWVGVDLTKRARHPGFRVSARNGLDRTICLSEEWNDEAIRLPVKYVLLVCLGRLSVLVLKRNYPLVVR
jgi:hypothetical protein